MPLAEAQPLSVMTDVVIFTIREPQEELAVLLLEPSLAAGQAPGWMFPGGLVCPEEQLDECARRTLQETSGISGVYLEQLYTLGRTAETARGQVISVVYYALVPMDRLQAGPARHAARGRWFTLDSLPELNGDVREIISRAHQRLAAKLDYSTIAFQFMPEKFTLRELQSVYETILREKLDKRNFRKQVMSLQRIQETGEFTRNGSHRPARLYRLRYPDRVEIIK
jgi:8-oxo-dGTP diphosphatase